MESEFKRFWSLHLLTAFEEALYEDSDEYLWAHPQINVLQNVLWGDRPGDHTRPATGAESTWLLSIC